MRRKEYYNRRVKADFAPRNEFEEDGKEDQEAAANPFERQRRQLEKEKRKKAL